MSVFHVLKLHKLVFPSYLGEADVLGLLTEALTAEVEVVLADQTGLVLADAAVGIIMLAHILLGCPRRRTEINSIGSV